MSEAAEQQEHVEEEPKLPRTEIRFGPGEGVPGPGEEPRSFVRINGEDLPVAHVQVDYDFGLSARPPRLRMEVMDRDYKFHPLAGYLLDEETARTIDGLREIFFAACGVVDHPTKDQKRREAREESLREAVRAYREIAPRAKEDLKRLADPAGSLWGEDEEGSDD